MAQDDMRPLRDTYAALQRAQHEREERLRKSEQDLARMVVDKHAEKFEWPEGEAELIKKILGIEK